MYYQFVHMSFLMTPYILKDAFNYPNKILKVFKKKYYYHFFGGESTRLILNYVLRKKSLNHQFSIAYIFSCCM
jgi:hypothetical protein